MNEKIIGILRNISELVVGVVVSETAEKIVLKDATFLVVSGGDANGKPNVNFVPLEMLSIQPPINMRSFAKDSSKNVEITLYRSNVLNDNFELNDDIINHYNTLVRKISIPQSGGSIPRDKEIVKLF